MRNTYVFILCPPYCGSTVLWRLLGTSPAASSLPDEGQFLPETREWMRPPQPWDETHAMPWAAIKAAWDARWDRDKPYLLEKSPPNLIRTDAIRAHFDPVRFVLMVRNPYAHCEGLMRRNGWDAERAAAFALRCLRRQAANRANLPGSIATTYESMAADPAAFARRVEAFLPGIAPLAPQKAFVADSIDGRRERPIVDLNASKLARLAASDKRALDAAFAADPQPLHDWGYEVDV